MILAFNIFQTRNKINEQQNSKLAAHREILKQRKDEMATMDKRIAELQSRVWKKRSEGKQMGKTYSSINQTRSMGTANKIGGRTLSANVAAVEPYIKHEPTASHDINKNNIDKMYGVNKQDSKYQTLPYNIKFPQGNEKDDIKGEVYEKHSENDDVEQKEKLGIEAPSPSGNTKPSSPLDLLPKEVIHNAPEFKPSLGHATAFEVMQETLKDSANVPHSAPTSRVQSNPRFQSSLSNLTPKPFGSTYSTSVLANRTNMYNTNLPNTPQSTLGNSLLSSSLGGPGSTLPGYPKTSTPMASANNSVMSDREGKEIFLADLSTVPNRGMADIEKYQASTEHFPNDPSTEGSSQFGRGSQSLSARHQPAPPDELDSAWSNQHGNQTYSNSKSFQGTTSSNNDLQGMSETNKSNDMKPKSDVSSALSVLMSGPSTTVVNTKPSYRYAPKSVIANTYMKRLGPGTLDQYRKNMNKLYSELLPGQTPKDGYNYSVTSDPSRIPESPTARVAPLNMSGGVVREEHTAPSSLSFDKSSTPSDAMARDMGTEQYSNTTLLDDNSNRNPPPYKGAPPYDMNERMRYKPNAPKLRRRLSSGESDDLVRIVRSPQKAETPQSNPESQNEDTLTENTSTPDIVRLDDLQDSFNNNNFEVEVLGGNDKSNVEDHEEPREGEPSVKQSLPVALRKRKGNLRSANSGNKSRRVSFDPLALLLDASLEGELALVQRTAREVSHIIDRLQNTAFNF